jgi:hypothetical protein
MPLGYDLNYPAAWFAVSPRVSRLPRGSSTRLPEAVRRKPEGRRYRLFAMAFSPRGDKKGHPTTRQSGFHGKPLKFLSRQPVMNTRGFHAPDGSMPLSCLALRRVRFRVSRQTTAGGSVNDAAGSLKS